MGPGGTQGQMLCGVHLPHGLTTREQSLNSFINVIVLAILIRCQKKDLEAYCGPLTEKVMTYSVYSVQDCQTCFSVQPTRKAEKSVLGPHMTELNTAPNHL